MKLNYHITEDYEEMSKLSAEIIIKQIKNDPTGLYCFAGGDTPVRTLQLISNEVIAGDLDVSQAKFIVLDEWVGLDLDNEGSCYSYLKKNLWIPAKIEPSQIHYFNSLNPNLDEECQLANEYIKKYGNISLVLLGVGVNGHLGFNEPGVDFNNESHVIELDESTQVVGSKYFTSDEIDKSRGITLGVKQLLSANQVIVQASGSKKSNPVSKLLSGEVTKDCPVTCIWHHGNAVLVVDRDVVATKGG